MVRYRLEREGKFVIEDYNRAKSFCSFLPAISGKYGLPLWCFYVNRAQGISSFGVKDKDHSILEFLPANKALFSVFYKGFRTFLKIDSKFYEPFRITKESSIRQSMGICSSFFEIEEENKEIGINIKVRYFTLPSCNFSSLVRMVEIKNLSRKSKNLEIVDGLPLILPYGCKNVFLKDLSRTLEAWMYSYFRGDLAFFRLKIAPQDIAQTIYIKGVNFYFSCFFTQGNKSVFLKPILDSTFIFGEDTDLAKPFNFINKRFTYPKKQILSGKTPSAFSFLKKRLKAKDSFKFFSFIGSAEKEDFIVRFSERVSEPLIYEKFEENNRIVEEIRQRAFIKSSFRSFNFYAQQNFLDNILRGGFPQRFGERVFYIYNRKHGDLERDYNKFKLEDSFLSNGDANYRDVNQNRRSDIFFEPKVFKENIYLFFNLQRADGYNPLVVKPPKFIFSKENPPEKVFENLIPKRLIKELRKLVFREFTLADFVKFLRSRRISPKVWEGLIERVLKFSQEVESAEFGEGFWIDHFSYNLDLIESFLSIFPDKEEELFFEEKYSFYDDFCKVKPRKERYSLKDGYVFQKEFLEFNGKKATLINSRKYLKHRLRLKDKEEIFYTNLLVKLLVIVLNKLSSLDPFGRGIEMEAGKPGWCDALNGLPSLLGSSLAETFELKRLIIFLKEKIGRYKNRRIKLVEEIFEFFKGLSLLLKESRAGDFKNNFEFWDKSNGLKEAYRQKVFWAVTDRFYSVSLSELREFLEEAEAKINSGLKDINPKNIPTYFINKVLKYQEREGCIYPLKFRQIRLPLFLEGFVRGMKVYSKENCKVIYKSLKRSSLYDKKLKMYKISSSLKKAPLEIGRIRVFSPGWLENESVWVHMEYKYLLELIKSSLYEEFYKEFFNCFICFLTPPIYGRSILENSSFIVSSAHPNPKLWGRGFVSRLTGATTEAINILALMCVGRTPFYLREGKLILEFKPVLKDSLFTKREEKVFLLEERATQELVLPKNCFAFMFLGKTLVIYHNPRRVNTYDSKVRIRRILIRYRNGEEVVINFSKIEPPHSLKIRNQEAKIIEVFID